MYIDPFWCGVVAGVIGLSLLEIVGIIFLVKGCDITDDK